MARDAAVPVEREREVAAVRRLGKGVTYPPQRYTKFVSRKEQYTSSSSSYGKLSSLAIPTLWWMLPLASLPRALEEEEEEEEEEEGRTT